SSATLSAGALLRRGAGCGIAAVRVRDLVHEREGCKHSARRGAGSADAGSDPAAARGRIGAARRTATAADALGRALAQPGPRYAVGRQQDDRLADVRRTAAGDQASRRAAAAGADPRDRPEGPERPV